MPRAKDDKPKGRMSAYAYFLQTCREEQKKKKPNEAVVFTEFTKKCAESWKNMSEKDKQKFHKMAEKDKARYDADMKNYKPGPGAKGKGKKAKKDPNAPKRALSAFFCFSEEERPKVRKAHADWGVGDVAKELGKRWGNLSDAEKSKFQKRADADKARYEREMAAYKKGGGGAKAKSPKGKAKQQVEEDDDDEEEDEDDDEEEDDE